MPVKRYRSASERANGRTILNLSPPTIETPDKTYYVDEGIRKNREAWVLLLPSEIQILAETRWYYKDRIVLSKPYSDGESCFLSRQQGGNRSSLKETIDQLRRHIALEIGESPAKFQDFLPNHFDEDFLRTYRYCYYVECYRGERSCIRPSHLIIRRLMGAEVKYPLTYSGRLSEPTPDNIRPAYKPTGNNLAKVQDRVRRARGELHYGMERKAYLERWIGYTAKDPIRKWHYDKYREEIDGELHGYTEYLPNLQDYLQLYKEWKDNSTEENFQLLMENLEIPGEDFPRIEHRLP